MKITRDVYSMERKFTGVGYSLDLVNIRIKTLELNKLALSREDDKRISIDGIASYAMGHY